MKPRDEAVLINHIWPAGEDDIRALMRKAWEAGYDRAEYDWRLTGDPLWMPETFDDWWDCEQ